MYPYPLIVEDSENGTQTTHVALAKKAGISKGQIVGGFANLDGDDLDWRPGSSNETGTMTYAEFEDAKKEGVRLIK